MKYTLDLNNRAFDAIINGTKKVEIRAYTGKTDYSKMKTGDLITFINDLEEMITCKIGEINHYETVEELLMLEGTRYTTSSTNDYEEGIKSINKLTGYAEAIKENGVYAIHIEYLYKASDIWNELFKKAKEVLDPRTISERVEAGGVAAAILSKNGEIYTGVCMDTACSIGMCAERNALSNMITHKENEIEKLICIDSKENLMFPCGVCREFMMQLSRNNKNVEILTNLETKEVVTLEELLPNWWT